MFQCILLISSLHGFRGNDCSLFTENLPSFLRCCNRSYSLYWCANFGSLAWSVQFLLFTIISIILNLIVYQYRIYLQFISGVFISYWSNFVQPLFPLNDVISALWILLLIFLGIPITTIWKKKCQYVRMQ